MHPLGLQRNPRQIDPDARLGAHLAGRRRESGSAKIGYGSQAIGVSQNRNGLHELSLFDGLTDLDMGGVYGSSLTGHRTGADRSAVKSISSRQSSDEYGKIPGPRMAFGSTFVGYQSDGMTQGKTFSGISRMESIDGEHHGNTHGICIIGRSPDGFDEYGFGMERTIRYIRPGHSGIAQTHDRGSADGPGALAASQGIADNTAVLGHDAAVRTHGRGRIMGFAFDGQRPAFVE